MRRALAFSSSRRTTGAWIADGHSMMQGAGTVDMAHAPPAVAVPLVNGSFTMTNVAIGGQQIGGAYPSGSALATPAFARQMTIPEVDIPSRARPWADTLIVPTAHWGAGSGARNLISMLGVINDILSGGQNAAQCIARIKAYVGAKRAAGFNRVVLCTDPGYAPGDLATAATLGAVRDWYYSADGTRYYDALADFWGAVPECRDASDATWFQGDQTHPNVALSALMAVELARAINEATGLGDVG